MEIPVRLTEVDYSLEKESNILIHVSMNYIQKISPYITKKKKILKSVPLK